MQSSPLEYSAFSTDCSKGHHMTVYGTPGGSAARGGTTWARNQDVAAIGSLGERKTARILDELSRIHSVDVLHDVRVPGLRSNVDHILISNKTVYLIDSKMWKPGFYHSFGGKTRNGLESRDRLGSANMDIARTNIASVLSSHGLRYTIPDPIIAVWPSKPTESVNLFLVRRPGTKVVHAEKIARYVGTRPAKSTITAALLPYLIKD